MIITFLQRNIFVVILLTLFFPICSGQTLIVQPPAGLTSGSSSTLGLKIFFHPDSGVYLRWNKNINAQNVQLKIGSRSGNYELIRSSILVIGTLVAGTTSDYQFRFVPSGLGLSTGRYFALLTNSTQNTLKSIQSDAGKEYSNEVQFIVEAQTAPVSTSPQGTITSSTPVFQWNAVPGVPAYWILLSSTPFQVTKDALGHMSVKGANLVWNFITSGTSARYGDANPLNPFNSPSVPLIPGATYNYVVLNTYEANNPIYASTVFSGVHSFTYQPLFQTTAPLLMTPVNGASMYGDPLITFRWNAITGANDYIITLYNRLTSFAGSSQEIDIPVWSTTTTNTVIDFPARDKLTKGKYVWRVIPRDKSGFGASSSLFLFDYDLPTGTFLVETRSAVDNSNIIAYQLSAVSLNGGVTPANPFLVLDSRTYTDSIAAGTYLFTAKKSGFADSSTTVTIPSSATKSNPVRILMYLRPLPALLSGVVRDETGSVVSDVVVRLTNIQTGSAYVQTTSSTGEYSFQVPTGTYSIQASKPGYLASTTSTIIAGLGQTVVTALRITRDATSLSGRVVNSEGQTIQLATVVAQQGSVTQEVTTTNDGTYLFTLSSGSWRIAVSKTGFLSPPAATYNLVAGDNLRDQDITLLPHANQVSGVVNSIVITPEGQRRTQPIENATISATSPLGQLMGSAVTNNKGEYTLNLKSGIYSIGAGRNGFTSSQKFDLSLAMAQSLGNIDFVLTPILCSISGTVSLPDGTGIESATVSIPGVSTIQTIVGGAYILSAPAGSYAVTATKTNYGTPAPIRVTLAQGQVLRGINFQITPNAGVISGRVLGQGQALNGATITASSGPSKLFTVSALDGSYVFNVDPGEWTLQASGVGFLPSSLKTVVMATNQQSTINFSLLQNVAQVRGSITDGTVPLRGAIVTLSDTTAVRTNTISNVDGVFTATVPAGISYTLTISMDGYVTVRKSTGVLLPTSTTSIDAVLSPNPSTISGLITDNLQQPLANVNLTVTNMAGGVLNTCSSEFNGRFSMGVPAGTSKIIASLPGYRKDSTILKLGTGQILSSVDFQLAENNTSIKGSVVTASTGIGIPNVLVDVRNNQGGGTVVTGADGSYIVQRLPVGTYTIRCTKTGFIDTTTSTILIKEGQSLKIDFRLIRTNGLVQGRVLDKNNQAVAGANVIATHSDGSSLTGVTDYSGNYSIANLRDGVFTLSVLKKGMKSSQKPLFRITATDTLFRITITDMAPNTSIARVTVSDSATRSPLGSVSLFVAGSLGSATGTTNAGGQFLFQDLAPGLYTVSMVRTGYETKSLQFTIPDSGEVTITSTMASNGGSISGRLLDGSGNVLKVATTLRASSANNSYTATPNSQGNFTFSGVAPDTGYIVTTDLSRMEYSNPVRTGIRVSRSSTTAIGTLTVQVIASQIQGSVGAAQVSVELMDGSNNIVKFTESQADGRFALTYLAPGNYIVRPRRSGYLFSPLQQSLTLSVADTQTVAFTATPDVGKIRVLVRSDGAVPLPGSTVGLTSTDHTVLLSGMTNQYGNYQFIDVPAKTYTVSASLTGYSVTPGNQTVTLNPRDSVNLNFVLSRETAKLSGTIYTIVGTTSSGLDQADIQAKRYGTGEVFRTASQANGHYQLTSLPRDSFLVIAGKSGYSIDSARISLSVSDLSSRNFTLKPSSVSITGSIRSRTVTDRIGVTVTASSVFTTVSTATDTSGNFRFTGLPIRPGSGDTTLYQISITKAGFSPQTQLVQIPSSKVLGTVTAREFILPSGTYSLTVTDGVSPLAGIELVLTKPDGTQYRTSTSVKGIFSPASTLLAGNYIVTLISSGYLTPDQRLLSFSLPTDTSIVNRNLKLPYTLVPIASLAPDSTPAITVSFKAGFNTAKTRGKAYYMWASQSIFTEVPMSVSGTQLRGIVPARSLLERLSYYAIVFDDSVQYTSVLYTVTPTTIPVSTLNSVAFAPEINNLNLRVGDSYSGELVIRDGSQKSLVSKFIGSEATGKIAWSVPAELQLSFPVIGDSTKAIIKALQPGNYIVKVTALYGGISITRSATMTVGTTMLKSLSVILPSQKVSNRSTGIQISYLGKDTSEKSMTLGTSLVWSVDPPEAIGAGTAAQFARTGFFKPVDSTFIGLVTITAADSLSSKRSSDSMLIYAEVDSSRTYFLNDRRGMRLTIPKGAITVPIQLEMRTTKAASVKKHSLPRGQSLRRTTSDKVYNFSYTASIALRGDSLQQSATLDIPLDQSLRFFDGEKSLARYDLDHLEWVLLPSELLSSSENVLRSSAIMNFGEYAILSAEEPLNLLYAGVLPSPFSPEVSPLKIGYLLKSASPPAFVTIRIFNIRNELIRRLLENDIQYPGRYGSRSSLKEITWNGMTDDGHIARNGRYIIQIVAKDGTKEVIKLIPVVLIR